MFISFWYVTTIRGIRMCYRLGYLLRYPTCFLILVIAWVLIERGQPSHFSTGDRHPHESLVDYPREERRGPRGRTHIVTFPGGPIRIHAADRFAFGFFEDAPTAHIVEAPVFPQEFDHALAFDLLLYGRLASKLAIG